MYNVRGSDKKLDCSINTGKQTLAIVAPFFWTESLRQFKHLLKGEVQGVAFVESSFLYVIIPIMDIGNLKKYFRFWCQKKNKIEIKD